MTKINIGIALTLLAASLPSAFSWGGVGHQIVGMVAQNYLSPKASASVVSIFKSEPSYTGSLAPAATWADAVKYKTGYGWSKGLHFADTNDSPPSSCGYVDTRDCPAGGCLVSAITNYTGILCSSSSTVAAKDEALKFIVHFFGDITQPLHVCGRDLGGNEDAVTFDGVKKDSYGTLNLHYIWDTTMIAKHMKNDYGNSMTSYAQGLISNLDSGSYSSVKDQWAACVDPSKVGTTGTGNLECPITWAQDTNGFDCGAAVWTDYLSDKSADLGGSYYDAAYPIIDQQLAKGGYRLGLYLNNVFNGCKASPVTTAKTTTTDVPITTTSAPITTSTAVTTSKTKSTTKKTKTTATPTVTGGTCSYNGDQFCVTSDGNSPSYIECDSHVYANYNCPDGSYCYQDSTYRIGCY